MTIDETIDAIETGDASHDDVAAMLDAADLAVRQAAEQRERATAAALAWSLANESDIRIGTKRWRPGKDKREKCNDVPALIECVVKAHGVSTLAALIASNGIKPGAVGKLDDALRDTFFDVEWGDVLKLTKVDEAFLPTKGGGDGA